LLDRARPGDLHRPTDWPAAIADLLGAPVTLESHGPTSTDKRWSFAGSAGRAA
jgi:adenylosuccinate synthase